MTWRMRFFLALDGRAISMFVSFRDVRRKRRRKRSPGCKANPGPDETLYLTDCITGSYGCEPDRFETEKLFVRGTRWSHERLMAAQNAEEDVDEFRVELR